MKTTKTEAREFQARWKRVNASETEELRRMSMDDKLRQLAALMASVDSFGWRELLAGEEKQVRERWNRLRKACHVV
ncbi:MAG TPA: hypothetical protein VN604_12120 [Nitrospirota bacterium]|nr:hypothetical protein [Nitrospirota bacterium]